MVVHGYLLQLLEHHQLGDGFINYVRCILHWGTSRLQINGHTSSFHIQRSVQGCPLSMILYILAMSPLLHTLQQCKGVVHILNYTEPATAYADDVTIFLNSSQDVTALTCALREYSHASGIHINTNKSKALPLGEWNTSVNIYNINYHRHIKTL
jgi:hypothetical protein